MTFLRLAVFVLYLPVLGAGALLVWQCLFLLVHGEAAGLFGVLYAAGIFVLGRRAARVVKGEVPRPWPDLAAALAADALLAVILLRGLAA
jgi:hypothetical protein